MTAGKWHHLCYSNDNKNLLGTLYLDGQYSGQIKLQSQYILNILEGGLVIGQEQDSLGGGFFEEQSFKGKLSHLRFYNNVITCNQVYYMYIYDQGSCNFSCTFCNNVGLCTQCKGNRILKQGKCLCPQGTFENYPNQDCSNLKLEANDGLEAYFPMYFNSTDVIHNFNGTMVEINAGYNRYQQIAKSFDFPNTKTSYFQLPYTLINGKTQFSISCWVFQRSSNSIIMSGTKSGLLKIILAIDYMYIKDKYFQWGTDVFSEVTKDKWFHILYSIDVSQVSVYFNSDQMIQQNIEQITWEIDENCLIVGQDQDKQEGNFALQSQFDGLISDYQIYNKAIYPVQVKQIYRLQGEQCPFGCETCLIGTISCISCKGNRLLYQYQCQCPQGTVDDNQSQDCQEIQTQLHKGLTSYYPLHNNVTDVISSYNGTSQGVNSVSNRFNKENSAYQFVSGTQTYLEIPKEAINQKTEITFSMWYKSNQIDILPRFFISCSTTDIDNYILIGLDHSVIRNQSILDIFLQNIFQLDKWYHIIISLNQNQYRIYLNGISYFAASINFFTINAESIIIGQEQDQLGGGFDPNQSLVGDLSDIRIYDYDFSDKDAQILYYSEAYPCPKDCQTCQINSTQCASCIGDRIIIENHCKCPDSKYDDYFSQNCQNCNYKCQICEGNKNGCIKCSDDNRDINNFCNCKEGWFEQGQNIQICGKCDDLCLKCTIFSQNCSECKFQNSYLDNNMCKLCPPRYKRCQSQNKGLECQGLNRTNVLPNCECQEGYYDDQINSNCQKCNPKCITCKSLIICNSCIQGFYLNNHKCQICPQKFIECKFENKQIIGIKCQGLNRSSNPPKCDCLPSYYDNDQNSKDCLQCDFKCKECQLLNLNCTICKGNRINPPSCVCPKNLHDDNVSQNCICQDKKLFQYNDTCVLQCPKGYYGFQQNCYICHSDCLTCFGDKKNQCESCKDINKIYSQGQCYEKDVFLQIIQNEISVKSYLQNLQTQYVNIDLQVQICKIQNCYMCLSETICALCNKDYSIYSQIQTELETNLVAYFKFDGNVQDSFGSYDGTVEYASLTQGVDQSDNSAYYFNGGITDIVRLPNTILHTKNMFGIGIWINFDSVTSNVFFLSATDDGMNRLLLGLTAIWINHVEYKVPTLWQAKMTSGQWHHLSYSNDNDKLIGTLFLDGQFSGTITLAAAYNLNILPGGLVIGQEQDSLGGGFVAAESFKGKLSHLRFYNQQLTSNQVSHMFIQDRGDCTFACTSCNNTGQCLICRGNRYLRNGKCLCPQGTFEDFTSTSCTDQKTDADSGLIAYYPMHNNATDIIGSNHGTIIDLFAGENRFGQTAKALNFKYLVTQQFKLPHTLINGKTEFSMSCWVKRRTGSPILLSGTISGANDLILSIGWMYIHNTLYSWQVTVDGSVTENKWVHILYSIGTTKVNVFLNGDQMFSQTIPAKTWTIASNGLLIGQDQDSIGGGFQQSASMDGVLSDYKIFNKAIQQDQAKKIFQVQGEDCPFGCEACLTGTTDCASCKGNRELVQGFCACPQGTVEDNKSYDCQNIKNTQENGLTAYYPLHNNVVDIINGYDGTAHSVTPVANRFGDANKAYRFVHGTSTFLEIPKETINGPKEVSFAMWYKQTQIDSDNRFLVSCAIASEANYILIGLDHSYIQTTIGGIFLQKAMEKDIWYHIIISLDDNQYRVYLNGEQYYATSRTSFVINTETVIIGQEQDSIRGGYVASQALVGDLSDFRVYNYGLQDSDAKMLYYSEAFFCPAQCQTCLNKLTTCATCKGDRTKVGSDCKCPDSKYDDYISINCPNCNHQCSKCTGTADGCTECSDSNRGLSNTVKCSCNDGWYDQGSNNPVCGKCDNKCATCHNQSSSTCIVCKGLNRNSDPPSCTCPYGYWDDGTDCKQCASQCNGCSGSTTNCNACTDPEKTLASLCLQCKGDKTLDSSNNCVCAVTGEFELAGNDNCQTCNYKCETCIVSSTTCQTCSDANRSTSNATTCACNNGYFENGTNQKVCGKCVERCAKCVNNNTNCTECKGTNRNNDFPNCTCQHGFYDDNTNANCQQCASQCNGCTGASDSCDACVDPEKTKDSKCLSCKGDKTLDGSNNCVCAVVGEFELVGNDNCQQCEYQCNSCIISSNNCQTCSDANRATGNTPKCACNSGWYDQGSSNTVCGKCSPFCSLCVTSASNCTQCTGFKRNQDPPNCTCQHGYYHDPSQADCIICESQCNGCTGAANQCDACSDLEKTEASLCLLCKGDKTLDGSNNCICNIQGKFELAGNDNCQDCEYQCQSCITAADNCQTCSDSNRSPGNTPKCACNIGWFDQGSQNTVCGQCEYQCLDCTGTADNCSTCKGSNRNANQPTCDCAIGYYDDGVNPDCVQCIFKCSQCEVASDVCTACSHVNRDLNRNCECGQGYFGDCSTACQNNCLECTGTLDNCTECAGQFRFSDIKPDCPCIPGYYDDGIQADCLICQVSNCLVCNPLNPQECQTAEDGYFITGILSNNTEKCPFECLTCDKDSCIQCALSNLPERILDEECICPDKYYSDGVNTQCQECLPECKTCLVPNECLIMESCEIQCSVCQKSSYNCLICSNINREPAPSCLCLPGYYQSEVNTSCLKCPSQCKECTSSENCTVCLSEEFMGKLCLEKKQENQFILSFENISNSNDIVYGSCDLQCATCQYLQDNCTECAAGLNRAMLKPKCGCKDGYHDNKGQQLDCIKCPKTCKTCKNQDECSTCQEGLNRVLNHYNNQCECAKGYITKGNSLQCYSCFKYKNECFISCPKQTKPDQVNKICIEINSSYEENFQILYMGLGFIVFVQLSLYCLVKTCSSTLFKSQKYLKTKEKDEEFSDDVEANSNSQEAINKNEEN